MNRLRTLIIASAVGLLALSAFGVMEDARAKVRIKPVDEIKASEEEIKEVRTFFDELEKALVREDLDRVMTFYSEKYYHRGITKDQVRLLWTDIFAKYDRLNSVHVFSEIKVVDDEVLVVCTGALRGVPAGSKDRQYVKIDSWTNQNHYLYKEKDSWGIIGGSSHRMTKGGELTGKAADRPLGFHPLY